MTSNQKKTCVWLLTAVFVALMALFRVSFILGEFDRDMAILGPGTVIRPMSVTFQLGIAWSASALFGGICALAGGALALKERGWIAVLMAFLALALASIPYFTSKRGFDQIIAQRKLVLEE